MQDQANTKRLLSIGESADYLGVSIDTLRRWEKRGRISPLRSPGGHRYFSVNDLDSLFGKRYTRDEETIRRTNEEIQGVTSDFTLPNISTFNIPPANIPDNQDDITSPSSTIHHNELPNIPSENTQVSAPQIPEVPNVYKPLDPLLIPEIQSNIMTITPLKPVEPEIVTPQTVSPLTNIEKVEPPAQPQAFQTQTVKQTSDTNEKQKDFTLQNVLLPKQTPNENTLSQEDIEQRINTIIDKERKPSLPDLLIGVVLGLVILADVFLVYLWSTSSRIISPIP